MARIRFDEPVTLAEVENYHDQARFGYEVPDNRVYARHVCWLLAERERLGREVEALRARPAAPARPPRESEAQA